MVNVLMRIIDDYILPKVIYLCYVVVIMIGFLQVISRYVYNFPIVWVEELSKYLFVWLTFFGAAVGVKRKAHVRVDFFVNLLPASLKRYVDTGARIISLVFMLVFTILTIKLIQVSGREISYSLGIPTAYAYLGMFLGGVFMVMNMVRQIKLDLQTAKQTESES